MSKNLNDLSNAELVDLYVSLGGEAPGGGKFRTKDQGIKKVQALLLTAKAEDLNAATIGEAEPITAELEKLAPLPSPEPVLPAVAEALGFAEQASKPAKLSNPHAPKTYAIRKAIRRQRRLSRQAA